MVALRRRLPSLTALTAFEAVARLLSFTRAADELGVTQAAVSRQIHLLEGELGFPLFIRLHRRIELTRQGRALAATTGQAFHAIANTIGDLSRESQEDDLTICASVAFSHFWLLPRIGEFSRLHPEVNLRVITQDSFPDLESGELDLAIRFGNGMWPGGRSDFLFDDRIFPVCSTSYAQSAGPFNTLEDLLAHPLITNDAEDPNWTGWREWLAAFSVSIPKKTLGFRCNLYTEAIYAALHGQGIALGWERMVGDLLQQNRLVRLTEEAISTRNAYFVIIPSRARKKAAAEGFVNWLKACADGSAGKLLAG